MISEHELWEDWCVKQSAENGLMDFEEANTHRLDHVWTVVESGDDGDGNWYAMPGFHYVNRLGYIVTERRWIDDTLDAIYFFDDMD